MAIASSMLVLKVIQDIEMIFYFLFFGDRKWILPLSFLYFEVLLNQSKAISNHKYIYYLPFSSFHIHEYTIGCGMR